MTKLCRAMGCASLLALCTCTGWRPARVVPNEPPPPPYVPRAAGSFGDDLAFLAQYTRLIVLKSPDGQAEVAIAPDYQGRVMTSSARGEAGASFGYVHRAGVAVRGPTPQMSVVGGEDRLWLGPEGGNFALFFPPGASFDVANWQVPVELDWGAWPVLTQSEHEVLFERDVFLVNYVGTELSLRVRRRIRLLAPSDLVGALGQALPQGVAAVGYESDNRITNTGSRAWYKETGLVSIWVVGMFPPSPRATVVIPFKPEGQGAVVNDRYFGSIAPDRLKVGDSAVFLRADGQQHGKLGVPFAHAKNVAGSYDPARKVLTVVQYSLADADACYVNSAWELQSDPYLGDVVNAYNDGPTRPGGGPFGPFYELESSSPVLALKPGASLGHMRRTFHFTGEPAGLDALAQALLGVSLAQIESALAPSQQTKSAW